MAQQEKTHFLRLLALLIDGGTLALKTQFDAHFPPATLVKDLQSPLNLQVLQQLHQKNIIKTEQYNLLFPQTGNADSSKFDVTLLSCLIQNLPAFNQQNSPVWKQPAFPAPTDITLAADVKRLRCLRNEMSHAPAAAMALNEFCQKWKDVSDIIQRLCPNHQDITNLLSTWLNQSLDPAKEMEYLEKLRQWNDLDRKIEEIELQLERAADKIQGYDKKMKETETKLQELNARSEQNEQVSETSRAVLNEHNRKIEALDASQEKQEEIIGTLETNFEENRSAIVELQTVSKTHQEDINACKENLEEVTRQLSDELAKAKVRTESTGSKPENYPKISEEYEALMSRSKLFFKEKEAHEYIETTVYLKAKDMFERHKFIILQGSPGEGKTTMAKHLLLSNFELERCLKIQEPSEWTFINFDLKLVDAIIIDDMFGESVLNEHLIHGWERKLPDILQAAKHAEVSIIITGRDYILEESKRKLRSEQFFQEENIQTLCSTDLTDKEKEAILKAHLKAGNRETNIDFSLCSSIFEENIIFIDYFRFGFPECASLFARQDEFFERGPEFFAEPKEFVRSFISQLYRDEERFLALTVIWGNKKPELRRSELDESKMSHHVKRILKKFSFKLKGKLIKRLKESLELQKDGLLSFSEYSGTYRFNHRVIYDMVGLVLMKENPECALEFCSRDFITQYITTEPVDDDFKISIKEFLFYELVKRITEIMFVEKAYDYYVFDLSFENVFPFYQTRESARHCGRGKEKSSPCFDALMLKHDCFKNFKFSSKFLTYVTENEYLGKILTKRVIRISGLFLGYGIHIGNQKLFLLSYSAFVNAHALAECIVSRDLIKRSILTEGAKKMEHFMALLSAVHHDSSRLVKLLVHRCTRVTEEALYIAAVNNNTTLLKWLLDNRKASHLHSMCRISKMNNSLIAASKKGVLEAVDCLIACGYNLDHRNNSGYSALDRAIAFKHEEIALALIRAGVAINTAAGKFRRTPLHTAADTGLLKVVEGLLDKGSKLMVKDHKGFYPIHTAAMNGHIKIVKIFIERDPSQKHLPVKCYGTKSWFRGKTLFHIAVYQDRPEMIQLCLDVGISPDIKDCNARTPFFDAASLGKCKSIEKLKDVSDINTRDSHQSTALHAAVSSGSLEAVKQIHSMVDNVNITNRHLKTPLHIAAEKKFCEIYLYLIKKGADYRMLTKSGKTVMEMAIQETKGCEFKILDNSCDPTGVPVKTVVEPLESKRMYYRYRKQPGFEYDFMPYWRESGYFQKCCVVLVPSEKDEYAQAEDASESDLPSNDSGPSITQSRITQKDEILNLVLRKHDYFDLVLVRDNDKSIERENAVVRENDRNMGLDRVEERIDTVETRLLNIKERLNKVPLILCKKSETVGLSDLLKNRYSGLFHPSDTKESKIGKTSDAEPIRIYNRFEFVSRKVFTSEQLRLDDLLMVTTKRFLVSKSRVTEETPFKRDMEVILAIMFDIDPVFFDQRLRNNYEIQYSAKNRSELHISIQRKIS